MRNPLNRTKIAMCVGAGLLALGLSVVASEPAWAMEPPADDGGGGGSYPDPDDGPPTHTPVHRLQSFNVRTDSVVATATMAYNGDPGAATVTWGDGTSTSRCLPGQEGPLHSGCLPDPYAGDPSGELVFTHRYATPANGAPFTVAITGKVGNESKTTEIGSRPATGSPSPTSSSRPSTTATPFWKMRRNGRSTAG
jgi:hypothetical protein